SRTSSELGALRAPLRVCSVWLPLRGCQRSDRPNAAKDRDKRKTSSGLTARRSEEGISRPSKIQASAKKNKGVRYRRCVKSGLPVASVETSRPTDAAEHNT